MVQLKKFKSGDTLQISGLYKVAGVATNLTGYTVRSQIKKGGSLIATFNVVIPNQNQLSNVGMFSMTIPAADTAHWTAGMYVCDIEFTSGGIVRSTETFEIPVIDGITDAEVAQ
jgi:hypothetical protein